MSAVGRPDRGAPGGDCSGAQPATVIVPRARGVEASARAGCSTRPTRARPAARRDRLDGDAGGASAPHADPATVPAPTRHRDGALAVALGVPGRTARTTSPATVTPNSTGKIRRAARAGRTSSYSGTGSPRRPWTPPSGQSPWLAMTTTPPRRARRRPRAAAARDGRSAHSARGTRRRAGKRRRPARARCETATQHEGGALGSSSSRACRLSIHVPQPTPDPTARHP